MIVGVIHHCSLEGAIARMETHALLADMFEWRLDTFTDLPRTLPEFYAFGHRLKEALAAKPAPVMATVRSQEEGGEGTPHWPELTEGLLWLASRYGADWVDVELSLAGRRRAPLYSRWRLQPGMRDRRLPEVPEEGTPRVVVSKHLDAVPTMSRVVKLATSAVRKSADAIKIAFPARDIDDCLLARDIARRVGLQATVVPMGPYGTPARIAYKSLGLCFTYGHLPGEEPLDPGMLPIDVLKERYRADRQSRSTRFFGVLGNPVDHSRGLRLHNASFRHLDMDACYLPLLARDVHSFQRFAEELPLSGYSVTSPYKEAVVPILRTLSREAREIGAVNTVVRQDPHFIGDNTDLPGFTSPLLDAVGGAEALLGLRVLVIGAGGVARVALYALRRAGARVALWGRTPAKVARLVDNLGVRGVSSPAEPLADDEPYELVINATPVGMVGDLEETVPFAIGKLPLAANALAYDLVYTPEPTRWLREAEALGFRTLSGRAMYQLQGERQFFMWTGQPQPPLQVLREI